MRISLEQRLPYTMTFELEPSRIVVDIHGAQCNSNWITQYLDLKSVEYVDFSQIESDVMRIVINIKGNRCWGYSASYSGNALVIDVKHAPDPTLKGMTIGLDAGHGGSASGSVSNPDTKKMDLNLSMEYNEGGVEKIGCKDNGSEG